MKDDLEVSGGLLSHICNISFPRAPTTTFCFLLGSVDAKGIVRVAGFHCPEWEKQNDLSLIDWREQRVKSLCQSKSHEVIGCCLVKPTGEATLSNADAAMARKHQLECNEAFVTAITGKDRKTRFFRLTAAGVAEAEIEVGETTMVELHAAVQWVGPSSLYYAEVVSESLADLDSLEKEAAEALLAKRGKTKKCQARATARADDLGHSAKAAATLNDIAEELGLFADWLCAELPRFTSVNQDLQKEFQQRLDQFPLANRELAKIQACACPSDIAGAGKVLTAVHGMKADLQVRAVKRNATGHAFDGKKWKHAARSSSAFNTPTPKRPRVTPSSTPSAASTSPAATEPASSTAAPAASPSAESTSPPVAEEAEDGNMLGYQLVVDPQSDHEEGDDMEEEDEENRPKKRGGQSVRVRLPVYKKLQCIRELDRLIESGQRKGLEKSVMHSFPEVFMGTRGKMKTGMLGRWLVQADEQSRRKIPFEKMSAKDQQMKDLPDWVRLPLGMTPRSLDRFKSGTNVPQPVVTKVVQMIERVTCGQGPALTAGVLKAESVKKEVESMLQVFNDAQKKTAEENGIAIPDQKSKVSIRWVNRLLSHYGWKRNAPNTYGAYLEFDDERMVRSRRAWRFLRLEKNVRLDLALNFDQVWKAGKREQLWAELHRLQRQGNTEWEAKRRRIAGRDARCDTVDQGRHSITIVTSLWGSGETGPLTLVLPLGFLSGDKQAELQQRFAPHVYFLSSGRSSHFMNAEVVAAFYETVLSDAFERRRQVLAERYQRSFQDEKHMATYQETCFGYRSGLMQRATDTPMLLSNGNKHLSVSHEESVLSAIYGWQRLGKNGKALRWAWLSRGMASYEEMCEVSPEPVTTETLKEEMAHCEKQSAEELFEGSLEEVFERPDVNRTTFLWQIESLAEDSDVEDEWEKQDSQWRCLPQHWQHLLNQRLAQYHGHVQDAQALVEHREAQFGVDDIKSKNARQKLLELQEGKCATSVVLMCKGTAKEVSPDVYKRCVQSTNGELKVSVSNKVVAYKLCVMSLKLTTMAEPEVARQLRIVSVTGQSREVQAVRLHLNLLSLQSSKVLQDLQVPKAKKSNTSIHVGETDAAGGQDEVAQELTILDKAEDQADGEAAELLCPDVAESAFVEAQANVNTGDSNGEADDGASDIGSDCPCPELEGGVVWTICPNGASSTEQNDHEPKESEAADSAASVTVSGEQFKDVPAFARVYVVVGWRIIGGPAWALL
ncbi:unnamed protein product [Durusdinium trenchii]|uniref:Uncharacterized protein n=1 Tax=Durusdinium trenchii TaxID=1381693 RepID=A0ABP0HF63_9DINO